MNRRSAGLVVLVTLCALALVAVQAASAEGNGRGPDTSSLSLVVLDPDDGGANYGEQVTFEVSTTATDEPFVELDCYQNGTLVYAASAGFFAGYPWPWTRNYTLASSMWTGGAADCTATLQYWDGRACGT